MVCCIKLSYNFRVKTPFAPQSGGPRSAYVTEKFYLWTDASSKGFGALRKQEEEMGKGIL